MYGLWEEGIGVNVNRQTIDIGNDVFYRSHHWAFVTRINGYMQGVEYYTYICIFLF